MKNLSILLALLINTSTVSWAEKNVEEHLTEVIELQEQAKTVKTLQQAWSAYKLSDYKAALGLWMPLAEAGNSSAQTLIGLMYNQGNAVRQDSSEAAKWYEMASKQEYGPAQWRLAMLYYHGSGIAQNYQKAAKLYHASAQQGDVYSQKVLGFMYSKGFGVPKDNILAYAWFSISKENGFRRAKEYQDEVTEEITPEETTMAQAIAKECMISGYTNCGWELSPSSKPINDDS